MFNGKGYLLLKGSQAYRAPTSDYKQLQDAPGSDIDYELIIPSNIFSAVSDGLSTLIRTHEVLTNSFDELKTSLHEDIASFKKTIEDQLEQNTENGSVQPSSTKSILSESGYLYPTPP